MDQPTAPLPPHSPREAGPTPTTSYTAALAAPPPPRMRRHGGRRIGELTAVGLLSAALATGGTWGVVSLTDRGSDGTGGGTTSASTTSGEGSAASVVPVSTASKTNPDWNAVTAAVSPSVVAITVSSGSSGGEGSGVILDKEGHVLTNHHVVSGAGDGAKITVTLSDGKTYDATVAGEDASTDLAVVTLTDPPSDLTPITMGSSKGLEVGDPVMAVGNPLGLSGTVTTGIVSALNRPVTTESTESQQQDDPFAQQQSSSDPVVTSAIQTSAAVNPGNSGGALVDAAGRLVGINSSIASLGSSSGGQSGSIGIGFAIPVDEAQWIAEQLISSGSAKHAFLGVTPTDGTAKEGSATRSGAQIRTVSEGSAAADAGLRSGDLVVGIDGTPVTSAESLVGLIHAQRIDSTVSITLVRDGKEQTIEATLGTAPAAQG